MPISSTVLANVKAERIRRIADLTNRRSRDRSGRFLIEGPQSVREAVTWCPQAVADLYVEALGEDPDAAFANPTVARIAGRAMSAGLYVHKATREVMRRISPDAQGIAAVGDVEAMREAMRDGIAGAGDANTVGRAEGAGDAGDASPAGASDRPPFVAAFWQVRDPGNAGTVIRAADAAGCDAVVFVDECVDMLNPKVIRSTAGSLFHLPVLAMGTDDFLDWARGRGADVIAADVYGTAERTPESLPDVLAGMAAGAPREAGCAVLFGNEARGLPAELLGRVGRIVSIPLYGRAESLNLGTSAAVMLMSMAMSSRFGTM